MRRETRREEEQKESKGKDIRRGERFKKRKQGRKDRESGNKNRRKN